MIRLSSAAKPAGTVTPGVGVKFLRDGVHSANFVAMYALAG